MFLSTSQTQACLKKGKQDFRNICTSIKRQLIFVVRELVRTITRLKVMKFVVVSVLAAAFLAVPCFSEPYFIELPGYAKAVVGSYGKDYYYFTRMRFATGKKKGF